MPRSRPSPGFNRRDVDRFRIRRIDVYGTDTPAMLLRKIRLGSNDGSLGHAARYYLDRAEEPPAGSAGDEHRLHRRPVHPQPRRPPGAHAGRPGAAEACRRQPWEFLVIDNGCRDGTPELLARHAWPAGWQVRVVREEKLGLSNARNRAIAEARGEYVIFMDDDETADPDWLCAYERLINAQHPDAFGGRIRCAVRGRPARPGCATNCWASSAS